MKEKRTFVNSEKIQSERRQEINRISDRARQGGSQRLTRFDAPSVNQQLFAAGIATLCLFALVVEASNKASRVNDSSAKLKTKHNNNSKSLTEKSTNSTCAPTRSTYRDAFFPVCSISDDPEYFVNKSADVCHVNNKKIKAAAKRPQETDLVGDTRRFLSSLQEKINNNINYKSLPYLINHFKSHCQTSNHHLRDLLLSQLDRIELPGIIKDERIHTPGDVWIELDGRFSLTPPCNGVLGYLAITRPYILAPDLFIQDLSEDQIIFKLTKFFEKTQDRKYIATYTIDFACMLIEKIDIIEKLFTIVLFQQRHPELLLFIDINELKDLYVDKSLRTSKLEKIVDYCSEKKIDEPTVLYFHELYESRLIPTELRDKIVKILRDDFLGCIGEEGYAVELFDAFVKLYNKVDLDEETKQHIIKLKEYKLKRRLTKKEHDDYSFIRTEVTEIMGLSIRQMLETRGKEVLTELSVFDERGKNLYIGKIKQLVTHATINSEIKKSALNKIRSLIKTMQQDSFISPIVNAFFMNQEFEILVTEQSHIGEFRKLENYESVAGLSDRSRRVYASINDKFADSITSYKDMLSTKITIIAEEMTHAVDRYFHLSNSDEFIDLYELDLEWVETVGSIFQDVRKYRNFNELDIKYRKIYIEILKLMEKYLGSREEASKYVYDMLFDAYINTIKAYGDYRAEYLAKIYAFRLKWGHDLAEYLFPGAISFYVNRVLPMCDSYVDYKLTKQLEEIEKTINRHHPTLANLHTSSANRLTPW